MQKTGVFRPKKPGDVLVTEKFVATARTDPAGAHADLRGEQAHRARGGRFRERRRGAQPVRRRPDERDARRQRRGARLLPEGGRHAGARPPRAPRRAQPRHVPRGPDRLLLRAGPAVPRSPPLRRGVRIRSSARAPAPWPISSRAASSASRGPRSRSSTPSRSRCARGSPTRRASCSSSRRARRRQARPADRGAAGPDPHDGVRPAEARRPDRGRGAAAAGADGVAARDARRPAAIDARGALRDAAVPRARARGYRLAHRGRLGVRAQRVPAAHRGDRQGRARCRRASPTATRSSTRRRHGSCSCS